MAWKWKPRAPYAFEARKRGKPDIRATVEIEVDWDSVARHLGHKAVRNKSRVSKALGGAIVLRAKVLEG